MKLWKILTAGVAIVLAFLALYFVVQTNSLSIALKNAGLKDSTIVFIDELDVESDGQEFAIFQTVSQNGEIALVRANKNFFGFWCIEDVNYIDQKKGYAHISWIKGAGIRRFTYTETPIFEQEFHFVYCGNDALKAIELRPEQLPNNATVNIQQTGQMYIIHIIVFSTESFMVEVRAALEANGCVPAT